MIQRPIVSAAFKSWLLATVMFPCVAAHAQMVQDPIVTVYAGIPATTYNGTTLSASICSGALDAFGDGCPATQAILVSTRGMFNDLQGNVFMSDTLGHEVRVVYKSGTSLAAALVAGNPGQTFTPASGYIYGLGAATAGNPVLFSVGASCGAAAGTATALDTVGDGCPAEYVAMKPQAIVVDPLDNIFFGDENYPSSGSSVHVVYVGGTTVANLIKAYNPLVVTPKVGYVYALSNVGGTNTAGTTSDFVNVYSLAVDLNDNLYAADNGAIVTSPVGTLAATDGLQIKKFVSSPVAGWTTFVQGGNGAVLGTANGDGGPYSAAKVAPNSGGFFAVACDPNGNLYIGDSGLDGVRVVYLAAGSVTPPLYVNGTGAPTASTVVPPPVITAPVVGNIYSVSGGLGGGSYRHTGLLASLWQNNFVNMMGFDQAGNLLTIIDGQLERTSITTGVQTVIGGVLTATTTATLNAAPGAGATCSGGASGPTMTNAYGGGCPAITVQPVNDVCCVINADSQGNFYVGDYRSTNTGVVYKYTFQNEFGSVSTATPATQVVAFIPSGATIKSTGQFQSSITYGPPNPTIAAGSSGTSTTDFSDAANGANDTCFTYASSSVNFQSCTYNITFAPTAAGPRIGSLAVSSAGIVLDTIGLGGVGVGAQLSVDPAAQTMIGAGLTPGGTAVDQAGNYYISSGTTTGAVYKSTAGGTPQSFATGFSSPKQVAVDGIGNVYVADSGNNRIAVITQAGAVSAFPATSNPEGYTATSLSSPSGVAVDVAGDVFISDTGNNRVIEVAFGGNSSILGFSGLSAPQGLAVDAAGDVFVADTGNKRVVELSAAGVQSTITVTPALSTPVGVAADAAGDLYIADSGNQNVVLVPHGATTAITLLSSVTGLSGVAADDTGDVFVSATGPGGLVELSRTNTAYTFPGATTAGNTATATLTLTNTGNATLTTGASIGSNSDATDFSLAPGTTNGCTTNANVTPGTQCAIAATFKPVTNSGALIDTVTFPASNSVDKASATLTGNTVVVLATTTTLAAGTNPLAYGSSTTITIQVATSPGPATSGTVTLTQNGVAVTGSPFTLSGGTATFSVSGLLPGTYTFASTYSGAYGFAPSKGNVVLVVNPPPADFTLTLASPTGTVNYHNSVTNTLTVTPVQYSGYNLATALTCTGVPATGECTVVPGTVTPNGTSPVTAIVTLSTGSLVTSLKKNSGDIALAMGLFGALGLVGLGRGSRRRWPRLLAALAFFSILTVVSGCSSATTGTYTLTITATGAGGSPTHSTTWTVQVQY